MLLWSLKSSKTKTLFNVKPQAYCISDLLGFFSFSKMRHLSLLVVCLRQMLFRSIMSFSRFYRKEGFRFLRFPNQHPTCFLSVFLLSFFLSIFSFVQTRLYFSFFSVSSSVAVFLVWVFLYCPYFFPFAILYIFSFSWYFFFFLFFLWF